MTIQKIYSRAAFKRNVHPPSNFQRWLHPNPLRRKPPLFGTGLLIVEVGSKVIEKLEAEAWAKAAKQNGNE